MGCWFYAVVGEDASQQHMFFCVLLISLPTVITLTLLMLNILWWLARKGGSFFRRIVPLRS